MKQGKVTKEEIFKKRLELFLSSSKTVDDIFLFSFASWDFYRGRAFNHLHNLVCEVMKDDRRLNYDEAVELLNKPKTLETK